MILFWHENTAFQWERIPLFSSPFLSESQTYTWTDQGKLQQAPEIERKVNSFKLIKAKIKTCEILKHVNLNSVDERLLLTYF